MDRAKYLPEADLEMIKAWERDTRYANCSASYLRVIRDKIYAMKGATRFDKSLIQYWLMKKEGRLNDVIGTN